MRSARTQIRQNLETYEQKVKVARRLSERDPSKDDGRIEHWEGKVEACKEILALLDVEAGRLASMIQRELGEDQ